MRSQDEEYESNAEREREDRCVARANLLEGEVRPFIAETWRQCFGCELLHLVDRLALRKPRCCRTIEFGGWIQVVSWHARRARDILERRERTKRNTIAFVVANPDLENIVVGQPEFTI